MLYYVRAYATNDAGTVYGNEVIFTSTSRTRAPVALILNEPSTLTSKTGYGIRIGGLGVVAYNFKLDGGAWDSAKAVTEPLTFDLFNQGPHTLQIIGMDSQGIWQATDDATTAAWVIDTEPPEVFLHNAPSGSIGPGVLDIIARGRRRQRLSIPSGPGGLEFCFTGMENLKNSRTSEGASSPGRRRRRPFQQLAVGRKRNNGQLDGG